MPLQRLHAAWRLASRLATARRHRSRPVRGGARKASGCWSRSTGRRLPSAPPPAPVGVPPDRRDAAHHGVRPLPPSLLSPRSASLEFPPSSVLHGPSGCVLGVTTNDNGSVASGLDVPPSSAVASHWPNPACRMPH